MNNNFGAVPVRRFVTVFAMITIAITPLESMPVIRLLNGRLIEWNLVQEPYLPPVTLLDRSDETDQFESVAAAPAPRPDSTIISYGGTALVNIWNQELFHQIRKYKIDPIHAARMMALLNVSVYDAILISARMHQDFTFPDRLRESHSQEALYGEICNSSMAIAGSAAAAAVLGEFFPLELLRFRTKFTEISDRYLYTNCSTQKELLHFRKIGREIANNLLEHANSDGSQIVWNDTVPNINNGWKPLREQTSPFLPHAGRWRTWLLSNGAELRPSPPPTVGSRAWQADAHEVVRVSRNLSSSQLITARFWADGMGTVTPAGHWLQIAIALSQKHGINLPQTARTTAYLSMATYDAFIACWDAKFAYWTARPENLLAEFTPAIPTPPFPAFPSGHATVSGAAAEVLGAIFPLEYEVVRSMALEAAESRIYGGIHWRIDNVIGLELGANIGHRAVVALASDG